MRNKKLIIIFSVLCVLTLIIVFNSVLFSVQHVNAYCYNDIDEALGEEVITQSNIKKGKSIFLLDKNEVASAVENNIANVKVINIEKKFPNIVYINYFKLSEYYKIENDGKIYYISNQGVVVRISSVAEAEDDELILIKTKGSISAAEGERIGFDNKNDEQIMDVILPSLERLAHRNELFELFEFIDLTKGFIYLKTNEGVFWELQTLDNAANKLRFGLDAYINFGLDSDKIRKGTMIISTSIVDGEEKLRVDYTENDRYTNGI